MCEREREAAIEEENPRSKVREVYNEEEGAGGKGLICLGVPLSAHFGAAEAPVARSPSLSSSLQRTAVLREVMRILLALYMASHVGINLSCSCRHYLLSPVLAY